jgi:formate dehydrogenase iron-sulfur subunit
MTLRIYVPGDAAARALGADEVAHAVRAEAARRGVTVTLIRNGTRGMVWLEPLVEVETAAGRTAFGPVRATDVPALFDAGCRVALNCGMKNPTKSTAVLCP